MAASSNDDGNKKKYVLGLDVGTTKVRAFVYDEMGKIVGQADDKVVLLYPKPGYSEINPGQLWDSVLKVLKGAVKGIEHICIRRFCLGGCI